MAQEHCVIIGNGVAGNQAALTLREHSPFMRITVIGQERSGYYKPHWLPDFICGKVSEEAMCIHRPQFYSERDIKLRVGQCVAGVDFERREVTLDHKEVIPFNGLIIACGGTPRIPEPLWDFRDLILTLKSVADAKIWIEKLAQVDSVLLVGGDLTSLGLTRALLALGKKVGFILCEESFWPVPLSPKVRAEAAERLTAAGVEVMNCRAIKRVTRMSEHRLAVETELGNLETGILGAFYGLLPDVGFLARSGLGIERGILVDEYLKTRFDGVYAAGDCAQVYNPGLRDYWVSIGYDNARSLGRIAAQNLLGGSLKPDVPPESIFTVEGVTINTSWWMEF